jgi:hypothetical protein
MKLTPTAPTAAVTPDRLAALKAEEAAAAAQVSNLDPATAAALESIKASGFGAPMFKGEAATLAAEFLNVEISPGAALNGSGRLAPITIETATQILDLAAELAGLSAPAAAPVAAPQAAPVVAPVVAPAINPPDASPLSAATAAVPVAPAATLDLAPAIRAAATAQLTASEGTAPAPGISGVPIAPPPAAPPPAPPPKSPGRPSTRSPFAKMKKPELVAEAERMQAALDAVGTGLPGAVAIANEVAQAEIARLRSEVDLLNRELNLRPISDCDAVEVWIDCLPVGVATEPLDGFVTATLDTIAQKAGVPHILAAGNESLLAFGRWEGYLTTAVREASIPPGNYSLLHVKGDKLREVFAAALSTVAKTHRGI